MLVHIFTMILGYSRRIVARAYPNERFDALLEHCVRVHCDHPMVALFAEESAQFFM